MNVRRDRVLSWIWLAAAVGLLGFPLASWLRIPAGYRFFVPLTPLDHTRPDTAAEFAFLWNCRDLVPRFATFTVVAQERSAEMALFMMSLGLLTDREALPTSYYGFASEEGRRADYVLDFGSSLAPQKGLELIARVRGGRVYRRRPGG